MRRFVVFALAIVFIAPAQAQSLSPMKQSVATFTDRFALLLSVRNPYERSMEFFVRAVDMSGATANVTVWPSRFHIPAGEPVSFHVFGAVDQERQIYVCVRSAPISTGGGTAVTGEVCGKYIIYRAY